MVVLPDGVTMALTSLPRSNHMLRTIMDYTTWPETLPNGLPMYTVR